MTPTVQPETQAQWARRKVDEFSLWFYQEFNKLLLTAILFGFVGIILHSVHHKLDQDDVHWFREQANLFSGGLLGLITGVRVGMEIGRKQQTTTATTTTVTEGSIPPAPPPTEGDK